MMIDDEDRDTFDLEDIEDDVEVEEEEAEAEVEASEADEEGAPPPRKPTRGERRFQSLANKNRELETTLARVSGQLETLTRTATQPRVDPREEQERVAAMSPQEYADYRLGLERGHIREAFGQVQFQVGDAADMRDFDRLCRKNPAYAKIEDEVEDRILKLRAQGQNVSRRAMANQILGEKYAAKATSRPTKTETPRRTNTSARSDVQVETRQARGKGKTAADRLNGIKF